MKYIDLYTAFKNDETFDMTEDELVGAKVAFQWIDQNFDQVPGRAVTESELRRIAEDSAGPGASTVMPYIKATVEALGNTIIPDAEPTNAELLAIYLGLHDLDAITQAGVAEFARQLDADGVIAPEANDE